MYRTFTLIASITVIFLSACNFIPAPKASPTTTATAFATPTRVPATPSPAAQPTVQTTRLHPLETIKPQNWARLQLIKTFPAEMPLNHSAVAIAPDGTTMLVGSSTNAQFHFFDLESGNLSNSIKISGVESPEQSFNTIQYLPDGSFMANSDRPYAIYHIDSAGNVLATWTGTSFVVSADGKAMAHGTTEGTTLLDIASNKPIQSFPGDYALDFSLSPDNSKIAIDLVGVDYLAVEVWDIASQTRLSSMDETSNVCFSPDGKFLAATGNDPNTGYFLKIFSPNGKTEITTLKTSDPKGLNGTQPVFSPDGAIIAAQIGLGPLVAWDTTNWQPLEAPALQGELDSFSPDGRILVTRKPDGAILIWGVRP